MLDDKPKYSLWHLLIIKQLRHIGQLVTKKLNRKFQNVN